MEDTAQLFLGEALSIPKMISEDASELLAGGGVPSRNGELHLFHVADGKRTLFLPVAQMM